jgi:kynureninase
MIGWDLAHAVGNVELRLHDWNVDFAAWCSYKYLNAGAGSIGAIFLHENHFDIKNKIKLDGWWSHRLDTRFKMENQMEYALGASAYAISNAPILLTSCLMGSLELFNEVGMKKIRQKSKMLTGYLEILLNEKFNKKTKNGNNGCNVHFDSLTPIDPNQRGAQLSLKFNVQVSEVHAEMEKHGIVCDYRQPNVIRIAPVALYNTFSEMHQFVTILDKIIHSIELIAV